MLVILKFLFSKLITQQNKIQNISIKQSFVFTFILDSLNINIPDDASQHVQFAFGIFILSLICLLNFINVVGYLISIYLLSKYDVDTKYPKLKKVIKYYENSSLFFVIIEGLTCVIFLFFMIIFSLLEAGFSIFN